MIDVIEILEHDGQEVKKARANHLMVNHISSFHRDHGRPFDCTVIVCKDYENMLVNHAPEEIARLIARSRREHPMVDMLHNIHEVLISIRHG